MNVLFKLYKLSQLLPKIGLNNIARVVIYRLLISTRLHSACLLHSKVETGIFFNEESDRVLKSKILHPTRAWVNTGNYFDCHPIQITFEPPNWFGRPISGLSDWPSGNPWWNPINQNKINESDIKEIWDLSRFHWVIAMAVRGANGDIVELKRLNRWLSDWVEKNPPYNGPNWRCGQEASIRVMHIAAAALALNKTALLNTVIKYFIIAHLKRISSTLSYAIAQDNNHGVLEAVGLFVGGEWLAKENNEPEFRIWADEGRMWIEERVSKLIAEDGSFSMYSVTYHREFLDALSFAEIWRRHLNLSCFSSGFMNSTARAALWLKSFTHELTGDAPNIGANDGTRLFQFTENNYRDFRPSVQTASVLFCGKKAYDYGTWDILLQWFDILLPSDTLPCESSRQFDNGGFAILRGIKEDVQAFMRYPRFKFRPSQADLLHLDLWLGGVNILRDAGSFSYNTNGQLLNYFNGTSSHNTIQIDGHDQMPRLSQFLFGSWHSCKWINNVSSDQHGSYFGAAYSDDYGASHRRSIQLSHGQLDVCDELTGVKRSALLRWRFAPCQFKISISEYRVSVEFFYKKFHLSMTIESSVPILRCEIVEGFESLHYNQKTPLPVFELETQNDCILKSVFSWSFI
jgi:hypothetical protein